jgi:hypothetical protein
MVNATMSKVRIAVEWAFRDVKMYFTHIDFPRKLNLSVTPAGLWYVCSAVLWKFRVCLYGSQSAAIRLRSSIARRLPRIIDSRVMARFLQI